MKIETNKGILYPNDLKVTKFSSGYHFTLPLVRFVPHAALNLISEQLNAVFSELCNCNPSYVFVLAPLHKGKIDRDDIFRIYTYSDCFVEYENLIEKDDEICSEEFSYEILQPYLEAYFPQAKTTAFFAPEDNEKLKNFVKYLKDNYRDSILLVSGTEKCCHMWHQAVL